MEINQINILVETNQIDNTTLYLFNTNLGVDIWVPVALSHIPFTHKLWTIHHIVSKKKKNNTSYYQSHSELSNPYCLYLQDIPDRLFRHTRLSNFLQSSLFLYVIVACMSELIGSIPSVRTTPNICICRPSNCITLYIKHGEFSIYNHETRDLIYINVQNISLTIKTRVANSSWHFELLVLILSIRKFRAFGTKSFGLESVFDNPISRQSSNLAGLSLLVTSN